VKRPLLSHALVVILLLLIAACGADAPSPPGGSSEAATDPSDQAAASDPADEHGATDELDDGADDDFADDIALPPGTPPACELLTEDEVASVLGHPVESRETMGPGNCSWWPPDGEDGLYASVSLVPLDEEACVDVHQGLGASDLFEYEELDLGVPAFAQYNETLSETYVATFELCTSLVNVGVRVEGQEADEDTHMGMAAELVPVVLDRLQTAIGP
jgi:hypothetical protein